MGLVLLGVAGGDGLTLKYDGLLSPLVRRLFSRACFFLWRVSINSWSSETDRMPLELGLPKL